MTRPNTTRRGMLRLGASAACAAGSTVFPGGIAEAVACPPHKPSPALAAAIRKARTADRAVDVHDEEVCRPLVDRTEAAIDALPHTVVDAGPSLGGARVIWSTKKPASISITRMIVADARAGKACDLEILQAARLIQAAHLRRERAVARIRQDSGLGAANRANDALGALYCDAIDVVTRYPVTTAADLAVKIAFLIEYDRTDELPNLLADAQRLATREG